MIGLILVDIQSRYVYIYICKLAYFLAVQTTGDVAYKLCDLVNRISLCKSPDLMFFEQHYYISSNKNITMCTTTTL